MQRYIVASYDDNQERWFWDCVAAQRAEDAVILVCQARPYITAANAASLSHVAELTRGLQLDSESRRVH